MSAYGRFAILCCWVVVLLIGFFVLFALKVWVLANAALVIDLVLAFHLPQSWHLARKNAAKAANPKE